MTEMLQFCDRFVVNAFDLYVMVRLLRVIFKDRLHDKRILYAVMGIGMMARLLENYYVPHVWLNIMTNVIIIAMLAGCYESQMHKKAAVTAGIMSLLALSEVFVALLMGIDNLSFLDKASNGESIALFLSRIFFWFLVTVLLKIIARDDQYKLSPKVMALETIIFLILGGEFLFLCVRRQESIVTESMILFTSEITFYLMIYLQDCLMELLASREQTCLMEQEKMYYQKEAAIILQKQELLRQFRHDLRNRLLVLNEIAERGTIPELRDYLVEIETKHKEQEAFASTGNLIIDSIINSKLQDAEEKGIEVSAGILLPADIKINTDDMVVILGNLLDNAIEACERIDSSKYIRLFMNYEKCGGKIQWNHGISF